MSPLAWVAFTGAAAIGAPLRYLVDLAVTERSPGVFPRGTFVINVTGSLLLGFLTGLGLYHAFPDTPRIVLGTGFCGAYTTFSTFTFETVRLLEEGDVREAMINSTGSLVVCAVGAAVGLALATL